ncbi:hypothetical protein GCM10027418_08520 [Mariniluteicoccus endophyticus]
MRVVADSSGSWLDRLVGWCFAALLGAMALYGAVAVIRSIWLPLCIGLAVVGAVVLVGWLVLHARRF